MYSICVCYCCGWWHVEFNHFASITSRIVIVAIFQWLLSDYVCITPFCVIDITNSHEMGSFQRLLIKNWYVITFLKWFVATNKIYTEVNGHAILKYTRNSDKFPATANKTEHSRLTESAMHTKSCQNKYHLKFGSKISALLYNRDSSSTY